MNIKPPCFTAVLAFLASAALAGDVLPRTLLTTRGKLLVSEDFAKPLAPFTGTPVGFASGFAGWKYNAGPGTGKGGRWELVDGTFKGIENPEAHHPATASYGNQTKAEAGEHGLGQHGDTRRSPGLGDQPGLLGKSRAF